MCWISKCIYITNYLNWFSNKTISKRLLCYTKTTTKCTVKQSMIDKNDCNIWINWLLLMGSHMYLSMYYKYYKTTRFNV